MAGCWQCSSVPEHERARRHALRSRLAWLGFGTGPAGVWIAPRTTGRGDARRAGRLTDWLAYASLFTAGDLAFGEVADKIGQRRDLDRLEQLYQAFIDSAAPVMLRWLHSARPSLMSADPGQAFADYVRVLTAWRRLPFLDPGLPPEFLPADWHGARAAELFGQLRARLGDAAREHVRGVTRRPAP